MKPKKFRSYRSADDSGADVYRSFDYAQDDRDRMKSFESGTLNLEPETKEVQELKKSADSSADVYRSFDYAQDDRDRMKSFESGTLNLELETKEVQY